MMTRQEHKKAMRDDHPAKKVVGEFFDMREKCKHYTGMKNSHSDAQCKHRENYGTGQWCAMDVCPLLIQRAQAESVGWD